MTKALILQKKNGTLNVTPVDSDPDGFRRTVKELNPAARCSGLQVIEIGGRTFMLWHDEEFLFNSDDLLGVWFGKSWKVEGVIRGAVIISADEIPGTGEIPDISEEEVDIICANIRTYWVDGHAEELLIYSQL